MAKLASALCRLVAMPRVAESPAALECKLIKVLHVPALDGHATNNSLVLGQIIGVHLDPACTKDGLLDITAARTIARCGYLGDYGEVDRIFEIMRPQVK